MSNFNNFSNRPHRYCLEKGSKKHLCPECNKKTFVLYIDTETGDYLPEQYGRCDRESNCSYHLNPYLGGYAKAIQEQERGNRIELPNNLKLERKKLIQQPTPEPVFFDFDTFKQTLQPERYEKNTFIQNLFYRVQFPFEVDKVTKIIQLYRLGTVANGYRAGANTFPFIDLKDNVRAVQVKQFDEQNHTTGTDFLHSIIEKHHTRNNKPLPVWLEAYTKQDKQISCLFGEHLLSKYHNNPVALVEAPKTAVYGTLYFGLPETPESLIWLAVYNKSSFSFDKLKVLQGRFVYVFPDLSKDGNTFKEWETKAKEYESRLPGTRFTFSDLLEQLAPERDKSEGNDLADYLIKQDWRLFKKRNIQEQPLHPEPEKVTEVIKVTDQQNILFTKIEPLIEAELFKTKRIEHVEKKQLQNWSNDIVMLETYFDGINLPTQPINLNKYSKITNCSQFIKCHLATVKENNGNRTFLPYLNRLKELKQLLANNLIFHEYKI
ncbi:MAG: hypothetical protein KAY50_08830 [Chitinophagaceae bacterium]|nr:hypothetical protein [Chitinophagaceae bacterium]